jgi:4'-phosphopantetheinyl transferase
MSMLVDRAGPLELYADSAHVWTLRTHSIPDPVVAACRNSLSTPEQERWRLLLTPAKRRQFALTRAWIREILSLYLNRPPERLAFSANAFGKPELLPEAPGTVVPRFNLSHCDGLLACIVARDADVGIDVERLGACIETSRLADTVLTSEEASDLHGLEGMARQRRFMQYWTLKESYLKARGMGLSLPIRAVGFRFSDSGRISACFGPELNDHPDGWEFGLLATEPGCQVAVSISKSGPAAPRVQLMRH